MSKIKSFFLAHTNFFSAGITVLVACTVMTAGLVPYRFFMGYQSAKNNDLFAESIMLKARPVGIAYDLEQDLLARFICSVAGHEPYNAQVSVGAVIINRCRDAHFARDLPSVILGLSPYFDKSILSQEPNERSLNAARDALHGIDPSGEALYFFSSDDTVLLAKFKNRTTVSYGSITFAK